jgi:muconolactone delta-isomerase
MALNIVTENQMSDGADPTLNPNPDNGVNPPAGALKTDKDPVPYERFSEVNKQLSDLKKWKQEQEAAAAERVKKEQEAESERLKQQGEFKTLAETWQQKAAELEPYKIQAEEANATLKTLLDAEMTNPAMPASTKELLADMSPTKALAHITKHKSEWTKPTAPNLNGAGGGKGVQDPKEREAELRQRYNIK